MPPDPCVLVAAFTVLATWSTEVEVSAPLHSATYAVGDSAAVEGQEYVTVFAPPRLFSARQISARTVLAWVDPPTNSQVFPSESVTVLRACGAITANVKRLPAVTLDGNAAASLVLVAATPLLHVDCTRANAI
jgi:hypothetical protein